MDLNKLYISRLHSVHISFAVGSSFTVRSHLRFVCALRAFTVNKGFQNSVKRVLIIHKNALIVRSVYALRSLTVLVGK